jgi:hypothetical protein
MDIARIEVDSITATLTCLVCHTYCHYLTTDDDDEEEDEEEEEKINRENKG